MNMSITVYSLNVKVQVVNELLGTLHFMRYKSHFKFMEERIKRTIIPLLMYLSDKKNLVTVSFPSTVGESNGYTERH